eukprot:COSAG01_NODE_7633_length_3120_cov_6.410460_2_plen_179_part_00
MGLSIIQQPTAAPGHPDWDGQADARRPHPWLAPGMWHPRIPLSSRMSRAARAASPVRDPPGAALTWVRRCLAIWEGRERACFAGGAQVQDQGRPGGVEVGYPPRPPAQARVCAAPGDVPAPCPRGPRGYRSMVRVAIGSAIHHFFPFHSRLCVDQVDSRCRAGTLREDCIMYMITKQP